MSDCHERKQEQKICNLNDNSTYIQTNDIHRASIERTMIRYVSVYYTKKAVFVDIPKQLPSCIGSNALSFIIMNLTATVTK